MRSRCILYVTTYKLQNKQNAKCDNSMTGTCKMRSVKVRKRTTYKMRTKLRSRLRILYVTTYKLQNKKCEIPIFDDS